MSIRTGWLLLALCLVTTARAEGERIGLVLGGGGARGAAHIGVLRVLERENIPIHAIAGTSIGAIVGGLYASGYSPDEIEKVISSVDWDDVFHDGSPRAEIPMRQKKTDLGIVADFEIGISDKHLTVPTTLVRGQKLGLLLRKMFLGRDKGESFDRLAIPFRCVATDIGLVEPVIFDSGDLAVAVRASMAVPGAFSPVHLDGKVLVDGGIVNNIPVDVARSMGVDRLIVVDVGQPLAAPDKVESGLEILLQMVSGMMRDRTRERLSTLTDRDVLIRPDLGELTSMSFPDATKGIKPGEEAALAVVEQLRTLSVPVTEYAGWQLTQRRDADLNATLSFVRVDGAKTSTAGFVRDRITAKVGEPLNEARLDRDIRGAYGRGTYESIAYRLTTDDAGKTGLEITPQDSSLGRTVFRAGLQINDDFSGSDDYQINAEARVTGMTEKGAEWRSFLGIGRVFMAGSEFYLPFGHGGHWFVTPQIYYEALNQPLTSDICTDTLCGTLALYRLKTWSGELRVGRDIGDRLRLSAAVQRGSDRADLAIGLPGILPPSLKDKFGGVNGSLLVDSLDNVRFPRHGLRAELEYTEFMRSLGSDQSGNLIRLSYDQAFSFDRNTVMLGARASITPRDSDVLQSDTLLGGLTFLSGFSDRQLIGDESVLVRAIFYRRLTHQSLLFDLPLYLGGSLEGGNVWDSTQGLDELIGAGSVFMGIDLPIGPLQLGVGRNTTGATAIYLTFGSLVLPRYH